MNSVPLDSLSVGYSLTDNATGPPAAAAPQQPTFQDHLQQARQQGESSSRDSREELRLQQPPAASESASSESAPRKEQTDEPAASEQPATTTTGKESKPEPADESAATEPVTAPIVIACLSCLPVPDENFPVVEAAAKAAIETADAAAEAPAEGKAIPAAVLAVLAQPTTSKAASTTAPESTDLDLDLITQLDTLEIQTVSAGDSSPNGKTAAAPVEDGKTAADKGSVHPDQHDIAHEARTQVAALAVAPSAESQSLSNLQPQEHTSLDPVAAKSEHLEAPSASAADAAKTSDAPPPVSGDTAKAPKLALPARASQHASNSGPLSEADRVRFVQRVARAFEAAGDSGQMKLRLSPPELGSLRLEVSVRQGVLTAHVEAETPQARLLLLDNLPALRDRLQEQNIKIERFDVDLMNQSPGGQPQGHRQRNGDDDEPAFSFDGKRAAIKAVTELPAPIARRLTGGEKLNVVI